jgi:lipopolysaccharide export system protein LptA
MGRHGVIVGMVVMGFALLMARPAMTDQTMEKPNRDPIRITADKLVTDNQKRSAQFSGDVKAVQGETVITADRLTIFYRSKKKSSSPDSAANIERMEADGHVRIEFDNKVAVSNQAVYIVVERKLVLSGPESKVISGKDEISGRKITFFRDNGHVVLEGDDENRVKAIIHSDQRGLN